MFLKPFLYLIFKIIFNFYFWKELVVEIYFSRLSLWSNLNISNRPFCGYRLTQSKCMWQKGSTNQNICGIQVKSTTASVLKRFTQTNITRQAGFVYALQPPTRMIKDHTSFCDHVMVSLNTEATNKEVRIVVQLTQVGWAILKKCLLGVTLPVVI